MVHTCTILQLTLIGRSHHLYLIAYPKLHLLTCPHPKPYPTPFFCYLPVSISLCCSKNNVISYIVSGYIQACMKMTGHLTHMVE